MLCAFDLLEVDVEDLRRIPIDQRKGVLAKLLSQPVSKLDGTRSAPPSRSYARAQDIGINRPADDRSRRRAPLPHCDVLQFGFGVDRSMAERHEFLCSASNQVDRPAVHGIVVERDRSPPFYPAPAPTLCRLT
jgi:hypothetical protein